MGDLICIVVCPAAGSGLQRPSDGGFAGVQDGGEIAFAHALAGRAEPPAGSGRKPGHR